MVALLGLGSQISRNQLDAGWSCSDDGDMDARLAKIEATIEYIQRDVSDLRAAVAGLTDQTTSTGQDLASIKNQLLHVPTTLTMWKAVIVVLLPIGGAFWWVVQQYLAPLLAKAVVG